MYVQSCSLKYEHHSCIQRNYEQTRTCLKMVRGKMPLQYAKYDFHSTRVKFRYNSVDVWRVKSCAQMIAYLSSSEQQTLL